MGQAIQLEELKAEAFIVGLDGGASYFK